MFLYIIGGLASIFVVLLIQRRLASKPRDERLTFNGYPSRAGSLLGIALNILLKRQGRLYPGFKDVPKIEIIIENADVPKREHGIYEKLVSSTGTQGTSVLPCFIPALMFKVWARLTSLPQWPLNPLGMIHYKTVITQWREIKVEEPLRVEVTINGSRATERGLEIDAIIKAFDGKGERVLDCVWTVLSRGGRAGAKKTGSSAPAPAAETPVEDANTTLVEARAGLGVRFSTATGDISPQHMYGLTAMIAGFKKPIAHGMWTLERAISDIREKGAMPKYPFTIDSSFKLPIFLPGKVNVAWTQKAAGKVEFRVAAVDGKPHMLGSVAPAAK